MEIQYDIEVQSKHSSKIRGAFIWVGSVLDIAITEKDSV